MTKVPISIEGLSVSYHSKRVLSNIYLNILPGNIYGLVGPNGAGKSTLFKAILNLIDIDSGRIKVFGGEYEAHFRKIAYVPQKDNIDWDFPATVKDIVEMGRYPYRSLLSSFTKQDKEIVRSAMAQMEILDLKDRQIGQLSGGQQQRVFLARALCQEAELFLLDEPFVGVDATTEERIVDLLQALRKEGRTAIVVHHDINTLENYFDHTILLNQRLIAYGPTPEVFTQENMAIAYGPQLNILNNQLFTGR